MPKRQFAAGLTTAVALALLSIAAPAQATFAGANGTIAFESNATGNWEIYSVNPDGTDQSQLTNSPADDREPAWSPDGTKIAFTSRRDGNREIYVMSADGSGQTRITTDAGDDYAPAWSGDGQKIAFTNNGTIDVMNADGSSQVSIASGIHPSWSADGARIAFLDYQGSLYSVNPDGSDRQTHFVAEHDTSGCVYFNAVAPPADWSPDSAWLVYTNIWGDTWCSGETFTDVYAEPIREAGSYFYVCAQYCDSGWAWSPDGTKLVSDGLWVLTLNGGGSAYVTSGYNPDWQPVPAPGYASPKSSTPVNVRLVPAYEACTNPNGAHGEPFSVSSCSPPTEDSSYATTGHGDAGRMAGIVTFKELGESPINPSNGDQADIELTASITDVRNPDLSDYAGELRVSPTIRITDRQSGGTYSPPIHPATASDTPFGFTLTCATTTATNIGSTCSATTTADAVMPGLVREGKRSVWGLGQVQVYDGGADGDAETAGDNTLFATQGLFVP